MKSTPRTNASVDMGSRVRRRSGTTVRTTMTGPQGASDRAPSGLRRDQPLGLGPGPRVGPEHAGQAGRVTLVARMGLDHARHGVDDVGEGDRAVVERVDTDLVGGVVDRGEGAAGGSD